MFLLCVFWAVRAGASLHDVSARGLVGYIARRHRYKKLEGSRKRNRYSLLPGSNSQTHSNLAAYRRGPRQRSCTCTPDPTP